MIDSIKIILMRSSQTVHIRVEGDFHKETCCLRQLSVFSLCSSGLISALLVLSTVKIISETDIILQLKGP